MKSKHGSKPEMNAMLVPTSQLRKEQEEEARKFGNSMQGNGSTQPGGESLGN